MQKLLAVGWPLVAIIVGLVAGQLLRRQGWRKRLAAGLLVAHGSVVMLNLSLRSVTFLGMHTIGYGPRYSQLQVLAYALAGAAGVLWLWEFVAARLTPRPPPSPAEKSEISEGNPTGRSIQTRDVARVVIQLVVLGVVLVILGIAMEVLRHLEVIHW